MPCRSPSSLTLFLHADHYKLIERAELTKVRGVLSRFADQNLTLTDAHGLSIMKDRRTAICWSTDRHWSLTGVPSRFRPGDALLHCRQIYWAIGNRMIAVHIEQGQTAVRDIPKPRRPRGHALLRLLTGGICNT